jgi:arylsulfatase A-like enzyme
METARDNPWFVYLPFDAPHHPGDRNIDPDSANIWQAPDSALAAYGLETTEADPKKRFNAVVTAIDIALGRVLRTLDSLGISENTFIFFYSDNGAFYPYLNIQSNAPLRGAGVTLWEGGIRVPAVACWPGKIKPNSVIDTRLWSLDLFPTCVKLGGGQLPQDRFIDGKNILPVLLGQTAHSPHATLYFEYEEFAALHWGNWKIIRESSSADWQLYNLKDDISEQSNKARERSDLVKKLSAAFDEQKREIEQYLIIEDSFMGKQ